MDIFFTILLSLPAFVFLCLLLYIIYVLSYSMFLGAPYAALGKQKVAAMVSLVRIKPGEKAVDIGAGDGRIVIALAKEGAMAYGYEINPLLVWMARRNIRKAGVEGKAHVVWKDFWHVSFSSFAVVTLYGNFPMMHRLEKKLERELSPHARVASNFFQFPHWKYTRKKDTVYLYNRESQGN